LTFDRLPPNAQGAVWMVGSMLAFSGMAVLIKLLGPDVGVGTLIFWRSVAGVAATLPFALKAGPEVWRSPRPWRLALRSCYGTVGFFAGFYALVHLPLADSQALSFSRTLFITVLAVFLLGEKVAWRRWTAVGIGFLGVLLMTRPGAAMEPATLAALVSALAFAFALVTIKDLTRDHASLTLVLYANVFTTLAGLPFLVIDPVVPSLPQIGLLLAMGVMGVMAQNCYVRALALGDASLMGLIDYVRLPLMALAGWLVFAETPDAMTLIGAGVVIASTLYITLREARLNAPRPPVPPA
jgi:drug/metabolite transporter (DMT)-like permease